MYLTIQHVYVVCGSSTPFGHFPVVFSTSKFIKIRFHGAKTRMVAELSVGGGTKICQDKVAYKGAFFDTYRHVQRASTPWTLG